MASTGKSQYLVEPLAQGTWHFNSFGDIVHFRQKMQSVIAQKQQALTQQMTDHTAPTLVIITMSIDHTVGFVNNKTILKTSSVRFHSRSDISTASQLDSYWLPVQT